MKKLAKKDVPVYGGSAGAIIFAKTIIPALSADDNFVELTDFSAFNLVKNYDMWCHYSESLDPVVKSYMDKYSLKKIIAIPENAGLYVTKDNIEAIGSGDVKIFEGEDIKTIGPGMLL